MVDDALTIVNVARQQDVTLRLLGAIAIMMHSAEFANTQRNLKRLGEGTRTFTDMDLIGYSKQRPRVRELMEDKLGYVVDQNVLLFRGKERLLYHHSEDLYSIDIFFDTLRFSHDIPLGSEPGKGRLELDYPTIPPTDLLLEKLQIHSISEKDLKDIILLLRAHKLTMDEDSNSINMKQIAIILANDWGFWKDATNNLRETTSYASKYETEAILTETDFSDISDKSSGLLAAIERECKTLRWKLRERTGESKQWWTSVEEVSR